MKNNKTRVIQTEITVTHVKAHEDDHYDVVYAEYAVNSMLTKELSEHTKRLSKIQLTDDEKAESIGKMCVSLINKHFLVNNCVASHSELCCHFKNNQGLLEGKVEIETHH